MKRILLSIALLFVGAFSINFLTPSFASAAASTAQGDICAGVNGTAVTAKDGSVTCSTSGLTLDKIVKAVLSILSWIIGVVAVIMVIISGFRYITSGGDSNAVSSAKNTLIYALIGVAIVSLAQFLVHFVLNNITA